MIDEDGFPVASGPADHELDDRDLVVIAASLQDLTAQLPADLQTPNSLADMASWP